MKDFFDDNPQRDVLKWSLAFSLFSCIFCIISAAFVIHLWSQQGFEKTETFKFTLSLIWGLVFLLLSALNFITVLCHSYRIRTVHGTVEVSRLFLGPITLKEGETCRSAFVNALSFRPPSHYTRYRVSFCRHGIFSLPDANPQG